MSQAGKGELSQAGLTLLEMLVVLTILGMVTAAIPLRAMNGLDAVKLKTIAQTLASDLKAARLTARAHGKSKQVTFAADGLSYDQVTLPNGFRLSVLGVQTPGQDAAIRFFSDGSASGGTVIVTKDNRQKRVTVNWVTSAVEIHDVRR
jgi:general secretion pathway protein H